MNQWKLTTVVVLITVAVLNVNAETNQAPIILWGGSRGANMAVEAKKLPTLAGRSSQLWEIKTGSHQYSIPTISHGRIYIGSNDNAVERPGYEPTGGGNLMCVGQGDGKMMWQMPSPRFFPGVQPPYHFDQWRCGVCSGPLVDDNRVYVITGRGEILCLDTEGQANGNDGPFMDELDYMGITNADHRILQLSDGDIIWKFNFLSELDVAPHDVCGSTLLVVDNLIYASTSNGIDNRHDIVPKPLAPTLVVLDKRNGRLVAKDGEKIGQRTLHGNWSSPIAGHLNGRTLVYFGGGDGILYAFEPPLSCDGKTVNILKRAWQYDCNPPEYRIHDGKALPYSAYNNNTPEGPSEIIGSPVLYNGRIYVAIGQSPLHGNGRGCLSCIDAITGKKIWDSQLLERTLATPAIAKGLIYIPDTTGNLHCFDAETGERYWVHSLEGKNWCASAFVADEKVYASTESNIFWVLKAGKEKEVLSRTRLKTPPITVTASDGVLYIPTQLRLTAISGRVDNSQE